MQAELKRLFIVTLAPCIPLSLKGEGEEILEEGLRPSWTPLMIFAH